MRKADKHKDSPQSRWEPSEKQRKALWLAHRCGSGFDHAQAVMLAEAYCELWDMLATPSESVASDDLPLRCKAEDGMLDMRVGVKVLAFAVENCPDLWDAESDKGRFKVTDPATFAKEVERVLNHESEDGSTRLTRMLDAAVLEAIEQGAEGVEEVVATDRHRGNDK
jgi:hypothetical protein